MTITTLPSAAKVQEETRGASAAACEISSTKETMLIEI